MSSSRKIRLFSDVGAKMSMFDQRAKEHRDSQMINPFSEWGGAGTRRKLSKEDPEYGRPVEGSKTAERGRLAQIQMIGDMVELCDMIYDCGIRSPDGRAAISFGDAFRLYSAINDKVVGLLMRGRKHKILDFEGEMLFQGRDDNTMIELLLPLNTIRHKYGMPERAGCGEVDHELLQMLAEQDRRQKQQRKQQRTRSVGIPPLAPPAPRHQKSRSVDNGWPGGERPEGEGEGQTQERGRGAKRGAAVGGAATGAEAGAAAGAEEGAQGGEASAAAVEGAAAAASAEGDAADRLQHVQQQVCASNGAEGGQDAAGGAVLMDDGDGDGDGTPSFLSELLRDHEATFGSNNLPVLSGDNAAQHSAELSGSADAGRPETTPLPEIRVSQGHVDSSLPTSADTSTDATATAATCETECSPPVGRDEGQRQTDATGISSSSEHQSCAGAVTATDASSGAGAGSCPAHERNAAAEGGRLDAEGETGSQPPAPPKIVIEPDPGPDVKSESEMQSGLKPIVGENTESVGETGRSAESEPNDKKHEECEQSAELGAEMTQSSETKTVAELEPGGECQSELFSLTEPEPEPESGAVCPRPDPSDQQQSGAS